MEKKAVWLRKVNEDKTLSKYYYVMTKQGLVLVHSDAVGELDLTDPKSTEILNKFVDSNEATSSLPDDKGRVSHFFGSTSNRLQGVGEAKFKTIKAKKTALVECSYTEV